MVCGLQVQKQFSCNVDYPQVCSVHILTFLKFFSQSEGPWPAVKYAILQKQMLNAPMVFHGSKRIPAMIFLMLAPVNAANY